MENTTQVEINKILSSAQAVRLSRNEVKQLDADKPDQDTETDFYNCAYYVCQQRNAKTIGVYPPLGNVATLAENNGITLDVGTVEDREVIVPFFAGGL